MFGIVDAAVKYASERTEQDRFSVALHRVVVSSDHVHNLDNVLSICLHQEFSLHDSTEKIR